MTKAERIFKDTRFDCKQHILTWGKPQGGFNRLSYRDNESICTRTLNAVEKALVRAERDLEVDRKLGVGTDERNNLEEMTLWMVRRTLENSRRSYNEWLK